MVHMTVGHGGSGCVGITLAPSDIQNDLGRLQWRVTDH